MMGTLPPMPADPFLPDAAASAGPRSAIRRFGSAVNIACLVALLMVMAAVIYGFLVRAAWEKSYYVVTLFAVLGGIALLVGLAQQEIAARDRATWRTMAEWQIRATYRKVAARHLKPGEPFDPDSTHDYELYYEELLHALIEDMQRISNEARDG